VGTRYILSPSITNSYSLEGVKPTKHSFLIPFFSKALSVYFIIPIKGLSWSVVNLSFDFKGLTKQKPLGACHLSLRL